MAREFSKSEIIRQKCSICGSKNKKFTEIVNADKIMRGYKLTCCNCGHIDTFFNNTDNIDIQTYTNEREVCIQVTTCRHKTCKYYGKYNLHQSSRILERILNGLDTDCIIEGGNICTNCNCSCNCPNNSQNSNDTNIKNEIEISDSYQLDINGYKYNNPKFH